MKKQKTIKNINKGLPNEDEFEIKRFIIILISLVVIIIGVYLVTELVSKEDIEEETSVTEGKLNYDVATVGTILNRPYDEYYVMIYDEENSEAMLYSTIMSMYASSQKENALKIFYCDLNNSLNSSYYNVNNDNKSNPKATKTSEFDFGDLTLLKIKKGKIIEYLEDYQEIKKTLKIES